MTARATCVWVILLPILLLSWVWLLPCVWQRRRSGRMSLVGWMSKSGQMGEHGRIHVSEWENIHRTPVELEYFQISHKGGRMKLEKCNQLDRNCLGRFLPFTIKRSPVHYSAHTTFTLIHKAMLLVCWRKSKYPEMSVTRKRTSIIPQTTISTI